MLFERCQWLGSPGQFKFYNQPAESQAEAQIPAVENILPPSPQSSPIPREESPILAHFSPQKDVPETVEVYRTELSEECCYICREGAAGTRMCSKCGTRYFHQECDNSGSSTQCSECRQVCVHCWKRWTNAVKCPYCLQHFHPGCEKLLSPGNPRQLCSICIKEQFQSGGIEVCLRELESHGIYHVVKFQGLSPIHQVCVKAAKCNAEMHFLDDMPVRAMEKGLKTRAFYGVVQVQGKMEGDYREYWEPEETIAMHNNSLVNTEAPAPAIVLPVPSVPPVPPVPPVPEAETTIPLNSGPQPSVTQGHLSIAISDDEGEVYMPRFSSPEKVPPAAVSRALEIFANFGYCRTHPEGTQAVLERLGVVDDGMRVIRQVMLEISEGAARTDHFELHQVAVDVCSIQSVRMRRTCCARLLLREGLQYSLAYGVLTNTQRYGESFHAHPQWRPVFDNLLAAVALKHGFAGVADGMKTVKPLKEWYLYAYPDARTVTVVATKMEQFFSQRLRYLIYCLRESRYVSAAVS